MLKHLGLRGAVLTAVLALAVGIVAAGDHGKCAKSAEECAAKMKETYQTRGWMGVELDENEDGTLRIVSVVPDSPAEKAGLKADDTLVSVNGANLAKAEHEKVMKGDTWKIGSTVALGIRRGEQVSNVPVTLARIPDATLAKMIEAHTKEHHEIARN
jgi:C-terminal processing protease CtpA/Prc